MKDLAMLVRSRVEVFVLWPFALVAFVPIVQAEPTIYVNPRLPERSLVAYARIANRL
jgi:hypothetical protein